VIDTAYVKIMARYNAWQNQSIYGAADTLDDVARTADRGAFFGSIHGTLSHLLWGDQIWMSRFAGTPKPEAASIEAFVGMVPDWVELKTRRIAMDKTILNWSATIDAGWLADDLTWFSGAAQKQVTKPCGFLVAHFFNHQTHHRGQVHAMLTAAGSRPDDTDLFYLPAEN